MRSEKEWIELFTWFHRHPELGNQEWETSGKIRQILEEEGIELIPTEFPTAVVGVIRGERPGRVICLRADIDALPVQEPEGLDYASENPGKMHACGHDFHITTGLYIASCLRHRQAEIRGTIYLVFQHAEETPNGGRDLAGTGLFDKVEEFYGFHAEPSLPVGQMSIREGGVMASVDLFLFTITGKGCHGAAPQLGNNPIPVATSIVNQIQAFATQGTDPQQPKVVSVTHIEAGETWNVIPETAILEGTVRTMDPQVRRRIRENILRIAESQAEQAQVQLQTDWKEGPGAVINDPELCEAAREAARGTEMEQALIPPAMTGDDFSALPMGVPGSRGLYLKFGTGVGAPLHSPLFYVDPAAIRPVGDYYVKLLLSRTAPAARQ